MKIRLSAVVFWGVVASILARLALSNPTLNHLYPYTLEGGRWFQKLHPGTWLVFLLAALVVARGGLFRFLLAPARRRLGLSHLLVAVLAVSLITIVRFGPGGAAYLVDTFLVAVVAAMLVAGLPRGRRLLVAAYVIVFLCVNSLLALYEYGAASHLMPQERTFGFFRATAFLGHPLTNGLITVAAAFPVVKMPWSWSVKAAVVFLFSAALLAFGARGATAALVAGVIALFALGGILYRRGSRDRLAAVPLSIAALGIASAAFLALVFLTEVGQPIATRLSVDASIRTRLESVLMLSQFSFGEIASGLPQDAFTWEVEANPYVDKVENFWVVLLLRLGLPLFLLLTGALLGVLYRCVRYGSWVDGLAVAVFLLAASTNNSLSSKNAALAVFFVMIVAVRDLPAPGAPGPKDPLS